MKRKNIIITAAIIIAVIAIAGIVKKTNTNLQGISQSPTPVASSSPQTQAASTTPQGTPAATEKYKSDSIKDFNVSFKIPEDWKKISGYDNRYEGKTGFMEFTALSGYGLTLREAVDLQVNNESKPFGDKPEINNVTIDSQEASIIYAVDKASNAQCAVLVKFPKPVTISATPYNYLIVWVDRGHIDNLAKEIKFIK